PGVELYVLDPDGVILKAAVPEGDLQRDRVDLAPIQRFVAGGVDTLVLGDDPRGDSPASLRADGGGSGTDARTDRRRPRAPKPFSAARIPSEGPLQGYLYVVLSDEAQDSVAQMVRTSYVLNLSLWTGAIVLALVFVAGYLVFRLLTRRVKRLATVMTEFRDDGFAKPPSAAIGATVKRGERGGHATTGGHSAGATGSWDRRASAAGNADEVTQLEQAFGEVARRIAELVGALERPAASRKELLTSVAPHLRTPAAARQGYLETLEMKAVGLGPEDRHRYRSAARQHAEPLGRPVSELF